MIKRMRADRLLVDRGLFESRAKAQAAIAAGHVTADGVPVTKPSADISVDAVLRAAPAHPWVSRGGVKLAAALDHFGFDPSGCVCLDAGSSTGGFTEVLLARGARRVLAVDVGRGQLHERLRKHPGVTSLEATDIRKLDAALLPERPPATSARRWRRSWPPALIWQIWSARSRPARRSWPTRPSPPI
jgi:23S rRNA (cytidine1920-2'-O)/16S rRNA (cytidine1409-2'-O)-methyltransferase